jgi:7-cyano-7-deazaguanine synthase
MTPMVTVNNHDFAPDDPAALARFPVIAVLASGGLDSAILLTEIVGLQLTAFPLYLRAGHPWEDREQAVLKTLIAKLGTSRCKPLVVLDLPVRDLYGAHWSLTGNAIPDEKSPDEAVFLPGRNVLLLAKAMLWCHLNGVPALAQGVLRGNPFPDATNSFYEQFERVVNQAVGGSVRVLRPYAKLEKAAVMKRGGPVPLHWSFSCIQPQGDRHCGRCNKCAERRKAFKEAGLDDPTHYDAEEACTA